MRRNTRKVDPYKSYINKSEIYDLLVLMSTNINNRNQYSVSIEDPTKDRVVTLFFNKNGLPSGLDGARKKERNTNNTVELTVKEGFITNSFSYATPINFYHAYGFDYSQETKFRKLEERKNKDIVRRLQLIQTRKLF